MVSISFAASIPDMPHGTIGDWRLVAPFLQTMVFVACDVIVVMWSSIGVLKYKKCIAN